MTQQEKEEIIAIIREELRTRQDNEELRKLADYACRRYECVRPFLCDNVKCNQRKFKEQ
jgi:hypothetical protein